MQSKLRSAPRAESAAGTSDFCAIREPIGAVGIGLLSLSGTSKRRPILFIAQSEQRSEALARLLSALSPTLKIAFFPGWDNLPYERTPPTRAAMGRRAGVLRWLTDPTTLPDIVLTTALAAIQRVPPRSVWAAAHVEFRVGEAIDLESAKRQLTRLGYLFDDRVDIPGEAALRGRVIDLFAAAASMPCRIEHEDCRIVAIRSYDAATQRSEVETDVLWVDPASEFIRDGDADEAPGDSADSDHVLPTFYPRLETIFDYLPEAQVVLDIDADERAAAAFELIEEAYDSRKDLRLQAPAPPLPPDRLYLTPAEWERHVQGRLVTTVQPPSDDARIPRFAGEGHARYQFAEFIATQREKGARIVVCGATERVRRRVAHAAERALDASATPAGDWSAVVASPPATLHSMLLPGISSFCLPEENIVVIAASDLLGPGADDLSTAKRPDGISSLFGETEFQIGDAVVHHEHGLGILEGLEEHATGAGSAADTLKLRYANKARLKVPVDEIGKLWRYGGSSVRIRLDSLRGDAWARRRVEVEQEIGRTAVRMLELARTRRERAAPRIALPAQAGRFAAGFGYGLTPDQKIAVDAVLHDLAAGRPMDRLVCGDVGFGKTEIALRAVAGAVFAGKQVAVVAPTTVLVRQHLRTFQRRFVRFGIEIAQLSRLVPPARARDVKKGIANGDVRLVIGTHALVGKGVRFHDLGLVVIDEEQRFGARDKRSLRALAGSAHILTLTATPIPRTLQSALVGLQDVSVISTPPLRRQPVRTVVAPFDAALVRDLLLREHRRGGQSFLVCPRVEDLDPMAVRLRAIVPELRVVMAHGKMPTAEMDEVMVGFADGDGDVLLATNIIESGLDVPRANTMLIWRADRFGLSQLHPLRGRVGRGSRQGFAYLLTDPSNTVDPATEKRLRALEELDRLGAGFAISARDLDMRGAGDLFGDDQAGHIKLVGLGLYQHLLKRAVAEVGGEGPDDASPVVHLGANGRIPEDYVPEEEVRINLYARLDALREADEISAFEDEVRDRFGPQPPDFSHLFLRAKLRALCREAGIVKLEVGEKAIAATPRVPPSADSTAWLDSSVAECRQSGERFIFPHALGTVSERAALAARLLNKIARKVRSGP